MLWWVALAGFGGAVKYVSFVIRTDSQFSWRRFAALLVANVFVSSFCGLMGGLLASAFKLDMVWQYLACGTFGYLGTQGLDIIILVVKRKFAPLTPASAVMPVPPMDRAAQQV